MNEIDPIQYGKLIAQVDNLTNKVDSMDADIKELLALANKSRGGFWMGMAITSALSGFVAWFVATWNR
ncbi:MAG TPA: hypothetical protein VLA24_14830 [Pseudomonadales bacterium]|jgi:hypothetical protein|nr:hypothetical protein [Pseudomonadales bacterium]